MPILTPLSQMDPRWKDIYLGAARDATIGKFGCLLTDMTVVANSFGFSETPATLNEKMKHVGGFMGAYIIPRLLPAALPGMIFRNYIKCSDHPAPLAEIDAALSSGRPVIIEVDYSPSPGMQNHWVVLYQKSGGDYLLFDPWPYPVETKTVTLIQRYGFAGSPAQIIQSVLWLDGPQQPQPDVIASFPVYATADDLALRSQPYVAEHTLVKRLPLNTRLTVLEADAEAEAKLGQLNAWLAVRDDGGAQGYCAAWYLSKNRQVEPPPPPSQPEPTPEPEPAPPPGEGKLKIRPTVADLALRTAPIVADYTLIKRLPLEVELEVLEPEAEARKKLGALNQWLRVQDPDGKAGYVAAWYVASSEALIVRSLADGLALRSSPVVGDHSLIKRLPVNAELSVLEPHAQALSKLGVVGQWLKVKDILGDEGYAAAWYLAPASKQLALGADEAARRAAGLLGEAEAPQPLVVRAASEGLALRSQPYISRLTFMKRLALDSELLALEERSAAEARLGILGEWLRVRDLEGDEGYVAAWYVRLRPEPSDLPEAVPQDG